MKKIVITSLLIVMVLGIGVAFAAQDETGRGGPSGPHFTLNILGVKEDHEKNMEDCDSGHRIFVKLGDVNNKGNKVRTDIWLTSCEDYLEEPDCFEFGVLDCDGTDRDGARFMLPNPDPGDDSGCTTYSVWIRALGSPKKVPEGVITTCGERCIEYDPLDPETCITWERVCSIEYVDLKRTKGKQIFQNVSKELLTMCVCLEWDGETCVDAERIYIFDEMFENYLWQYDNAGLKHVQIRFYYEPSCPGDDGDPWNCP